MKKIFLEEQPFKFTGNCPKDIDRASRKSFIQEHLNFGKSSEKVWYLGPSPQIHHDRSNTQGGCGQEYKHPSPPDPILGL